MAQDSQATATVAFAGPGVQTSDVQFSPRLGTTVNEFSKLYLSASSAYTVTRRPTRCPWPATPVPVHVRFRACYTTACPSGFKERWRRMLRGEPSKMRTGKETKDVTLVLVMVLQWVPRRRGGPPIFVIRGSGVPTVNNSGGGPDRMMKCCGSPSL